MKTVSQFYYLNNNQFVLEYEFNSVVLPLRDYNFLKLVDSQFVANNITYISYNPDNREKIRRELNNSFDTAIQNLNASNNSDEYIRFDYDRTILTWEQIYNNLTFYRYLDYRDLYPELDMIQVQYDSIKLHVLQGYNFEEFPGIIIKAYYVDGATRIYVAQQSYIREDTLKYNPKLLRFDDRIYDRYLQIRVPQLESLKHIETVIDGDKFPDKNNAILKIEILNIVDIGEDTRGTMKLIADGPFYEDDTRIINVFTDVVQNNIFPIVRESMNGDYFEFFASYGNDFISNLVYTNPEFDDIVIYHELSIEENTILANGEYKGEITQTVTYLQTREDGFDRPYVFRPVIMNPNAVSFIIYYFIRIMKRAGSLMNEQSQIIRSASLTYMNAQKYGRWLQKLNVNIENPVKVVNRVVSIDENTTQNKETLVYGGNFGNDPFKNYNLLKSEFVLPVERANLSVSIEQDITNYEDDLPIIPNGTGTLVLNTLSDTFYHFRIYRNENGNAIPVKIYQGKEIKYELVFNETLSVSNRNPFNENNENIIIHENSLFFYIPKDIIAQIETDKADIIMKNLNHIYNNVETVNELTNFEVSLIQLNVEIIK